MQIEHLIVLAMQFLGGIQRYSRTAATPAPSKVSPKTQ